MTKAVIVEDEALAAERLEQLIHKIDKDILVVAKPDSIAAAVKWFSQNKPDLVFMDIHLSDGLCFKIFERAEIKSPIIFTTAYDQYAIKAFKVNSIDYLLKPIHEKELAAAIQKFKSMRTETSADFQELLKSFLQKPEYQKRFLVNAGQKIRSVDVNEVAFFYADEKIVILQTREALVKYPLDYTLDKLEEVLVPSSFFRINRKLIVSMDAIKSMYAYSKGRIILELMPKPDFETIVSIDRGAEFKQWLNK